jgi:DNA-binding transcriptional LysR family regulator
LRITCSIALGERFVAPIVRRFTKTHPRLSVTLDLSNHITDLIGEGYDIGVRTRQVVDARLTGRQIASRPVEVCASPAYLATAGVPNTLDDLKHHECLVGSSHTWHFLERGTPKLFTPRGRWRCNSGPAVVDAAIAGMGVCQLPAFYVREHIAAGRLTRILAEMQGEPEPIWAVYPQRRHFLPKIRNLVETLVFELPEALNIQSLYE